MQPDSGYVKVGKYHLHRKSLLMYDFACEPAKCGEKGLFCCSEFVVDVSKKEIDRITDVLDVAAQFADISVDGDYNDFYEVESGENFLEELEDGACVFEYRAGNDSRCALHSAALKTGQAPNALKPFVCSIFPLQLSEDGKGNRYIDLLAPDDYPCLKKKKRSHRVSKGIVELLNALYGEETGEAVEAVERVIE